MKMFPTLFSFALIATHAVATPSEEICVLQMSINGNMVTLQGIVDPQDWSWSNYELIIEARKGANRSLSRQAGKFGDETTQTSRGLLVLSTTKLFVPDGSGLTATLHVEDENADRSVSCFLDYK
jgi:hypothetical protein